MKFAFIDEEKATWPVVAMCDVLAVSRSGFYAWKARPVSARTEPLHERLGDGSMLEQHTCLDVPLLSRLGEVRRRHEREPLVDDDTLGVELRPLRAELARFGIVIDRRERHVGRPVLAGELVEEAHDLGGLVFVASSLRGQVDEEIHLDARPRAKTSGERREDGPPVVDDERRDTHVAFRQTEDVLQNDARITDGVVSQSSIATDSRGGSDLHVKPDAARLDFDGGDRRRHRLLRDHHGQKFRSALSPTAGLKPAQLPAPPAQCPGHHPEAPCDLAHLRPALYLAEGALPEFALVTDDGHAPSFP